MVLFYIYYFRFSRGFCNFGRITHDLLLVFVHIILDFLVLFSFSFVLSSFGKSLKKLIFI